MNSFPSDCIVADDGVLTSDPTALGEEDGGVLIPFGGKQAHKGYGLSFMVEVLSGLLTGIGFSHDPTAFSNDGAFIAVFDVDRFQDADAFTHLMSDFIAYLKDSRLADGATEILYPGELEHRTEAARRKEGISIEESTFNRLRETATRLESTWRASNPESARNGTAQLLNRLGRQSHATRRTTAAVMTSAARTEIASATKPLTLAPKGREPSQPTDHSAMIRPRSASGDRFWISVVMPVNANVIPIPDNANMASAKWTVATAESATRLTAMTTKPPPASRERANRRCNGANNKNPKAAPIPNDEASAPTILSPPPKWAAKEGARVSEGSDP